MPKASPIQIYNYPYALYTIIPSVGNSVGYIGGGKSLVRYMMAAISIIVSTNPRGDIYQMRNRPKAVMARVASNTAVITIARHILSSSLIGYLFWSFIIQSHKIINIASIYFMCC